MWRGGEAGSFLPRFALDSRLPAKVDPLDLGSLGFFTFLGEGGVVGAFSSLLKELAAEMGPAK